MVAHHNIRGLKNKLSELKLYLKQNTPDILTLNETLVIPPNIKIPGYKISVPKVITGRGVAILYKQHLNITEIDEVVLDTTTLQHNLHHSILLNTHTIPIQITTIYCRLGRVSIDLLTQIIRRHKHNIITGDFNSKHQDFGHNTHSPGGNRLVNTMNIHKLTKLNDNEPTFTCDKSHRQDVKDLMFSSKELTKNFEEFWVDEDLGSDHNIISAIFSHQNTLYDSKPRYIYLHHKADWEKINLEVRTKMQETVINSQSSCKELDEYITHLTSTITETVESNVKKIEVQKKSIGLPQDVIEMIKEKRKLRKLYHRTGITFYKIQYNAISKKIKFLVKKEHKKRWEKTCDDLELNPLQDTTWNNIKRLMGLKNKRVEIPTLITKKNGKIHKATTTEQKVEVMSETMESIFTHDNPKPYFDNEYKTKVENELEAYTEHLKPQSIPRGIDVKNTEHSISKEDIKY